MSVLAGVLVALALSAQQTPPPAQHPQDPSTLPDVVVDARSHEEVARQFVDAIADPLPNRGPARWDRTVCIGVANLRADVAQPLIDRVSQIAMQVGLEPGEPGCRPNVMIIATSDGQAMARAMVEARPRLFNTGISGVNQSRSALTQFENSQEAVRWWLLSLPVDSETGSIATRLPGYAPPVINTFAASRLRTQIQNDLRGAFIIVDFTKASGLELGQLADYIAMVALAQVDPDADTRSFDTILNLFDDPAGNPGLTDWDEAYLRALYSAELNQRSVTAQQGEVARGMTQDPPRDQQPE